MSRSISVADARLIRDRSLADPVWWMREVLGCEPWPVQAEIAEAVRDNRRVAVPSCHSAGKSFISARIALWWLFCNPGSLVITTAPTHRQVRDVLWREIRQAYAKAKTPLGGNLPPSEPRLAIRDGWLMIGFSTDDPDRFQGFHAPKLLVVADEAPGIPQQIWEGIEGVLASGDARLLAIGNPVEPSGPFYEMCKPGSGARRIPISAFNTPNFTAQGITQRDIASGAWRRKAGGSPYPMLVAPDWVADRYQRWGPTSPMYLSRVLGEFPQSATDALIHLAWVEAAQQRYEDERAQRQESHERETGLTVLAGDLSRFGEDETVCVLRRGHRAELLWTSSQEDTMQTAGRFAASMREVRPDVTVLDEIGVGAGVVDRLQELRIGKVRGLNSGAQPTDTEQFANARAEWWWGLRELFERGEIAIPPDEELAAQLTSIKYKFQSNGKVLIESKDDMKKRGLSSPDRADTLMLAFAASMPSAEIIIPGRLPRPTKSAVQAWLDDDDEKPRRKRGWM